MIVTRTPLRISFIGGGSDLNAWLRRGEEGAVISTTIDKYVYVCLSRHWDPSRIRVSYSMTENVERLEHVQHDIVRECLRQTNTQSGIEIVTIADLPGHGTGMGSSSAVAAGTLLALWRLQGQPVPSQQDLLEWTIEIEQRATGHVSGMQDQAAVVNGGLREYRFHADEPIHMETFDDQVGRWLQSHVQLLWTGTTRSAASILRSVQRRMAMDAKVRHATRALVNLVPQARKALEHNRIDDFGAIVGEGWRLKRETSPMVSTPAIDEAITRGVAHGAYGGKLLGAGGGGFILMITPPDRQIEVATAVGLREIDVRLSKQGARVIYDRGRPL